MQTIEFENHSLSKLGFGTVQLGLDYGISNTEGKPAQATAESIIQYLTDNGINCFDTAVAYGNSEEVLGNALLKRTDINIISKVKSDLFTSDLAKTLDQSLYHLKIRKLFALLLHDSELLNDWCLKKSAAVSLLQEKELIEYFGVSIYTSGEFDAALNNPVIKVIQIPFNIFDQRAINDKWFTRAKKANKLIFVRSIFLQGLFFMKSKQLTGNLVEAIPFLEEMHKMRSNLNLSITGFVMAYVNSVAIDAVILFGCNTLEQARENVNSYNHFPTIDRATLDKINAIFSDIPEHITNPGQWNS